MTVLERTMIEDPMGFARGMVVKVDDEGKTLFGWALLDELDDVYTETHEFLKSIPYYAECVTDEDCLLPPGVEVLELKGTAKNWAELEDLAVERANDDKDNLYIGKEPRLYTTRNRNTAVLKNIKEDASFDLVSASDVKEVEVMLLYIRKALEEAESEKSTE